MTATSIAIGLAAGLVSALLFAVVSAGSPLAMVLTYAAPLPVMIAALGWTHRAGLVAVATGALALTLLLRPTTGLAHVVAAGLPGWWIAYLALLGRPSANAEGATEWYPLGRLVAWIAAVAAAVALAGALALGNGDYDAFRDLLIRLVEAFLRANAKAPDGAALPSVAGLPGRRVADLVVAVAPLLAAAMFCAFFVANCWLAARAVAISGRLARPWPFVPGTRMGREMLVVLGAGAIVAVLAPGYAGVAGGAVAGAFAMAFALQGLAFLHAATLGRPGRTPLLLSAYILSVFFGGTFLPMLSLLGLLDTATPLRERLSARKPTLD